jgi:hypothetical protein
MIIVFIQKEQFIIDSSIVAELTITQKIHALNMCAALVQTLVGVIVCLEEGGPMQQLVKNYLETTIGLKLL